MPLFVDKLKVTSPDIRALGPIPERFSADGGNEIPRLEISGLPAGTVECAVICHDSDAPLPQGFTHWTVYGIAPDEGELDLTTSGARTGPNGMGQSAWSGPQPPPGHGVHHYYFWVFALSQPVEGNPTREQFLAAYSDAIIEQARFVSTFQR